MRKSVRTPLTLAALLALGACGAFKSHQRHTPVLGERIPILVGENEASPDATLASVAVTVPDPVANDAWGQPGGDAAKSMGQLALGASPTRVWTADIAGGSNRERLAAAPVISGGRLYMNDVNATVHAFDAQTGHELWSTGIAEGGKRTQAARFGGGVSIEGDRLFATDGLGDAVAMNASDGKILWRAKPGGPLRGSPSLANGQVYVLSQDNQLFALSQADGSVLWTQSASLETQGVFGVAAPAAAAGTIVAGFSSGELNAYRYENGRTLWQDALSRSSVTTSVSSLSDIDADPVMDEGRVYAVGQGGRMVAIEIATGQRVWEQNFAGIDTPWLAGEWLFVVTDDAKLVCIARATGKVRWLADLQHYRVPKKKKDVVIWKGPVLAGGRLVMVNSLGQIVYASPTDGTIQATVETKDPLVLPPVVANNTLYTVDARGRISAWR